MIYFYLLVQLNQRKLKLYNYFINDPLDKWIKVSEEGLGFAPVKHQPMVF